MSDRAFWIEAAGMARSLAHLYRREGNVSEFLRHIKRGRWYLTQERNYRNSEIRRAERERTRDAA